MGIFDITVSVLALVALVNGWRKGLIAQICGIVAIFGGIWLAAEFGSDVGAMFGVEARYAKAAGFLVIFLLTMVALAVISKMIQKLFSFVGLGVLNSIFGALLSVAKTALILGVLCSAFESLNAGFNLVDKDKLNKTIFFRPLCRATEVFELFDIEEVGKDLEKTVKNTVDNINI
jgi:membrane protein required for colicin V production